MGRLFRNRCNSQCAEKDNRRHMHNSHTHRALWARFAARVVDSREAPLEARKQQAHPAPSSRSGPQRANLQILFFCGSTKWWKRGLYPGRSFPDALMKRRALLLLLAGAGAAQTCAPWSVSRPPPRCRSPASRAEEVRGRGARSLEKRDEDLMSFGFRV